MSEMAHSYYLNILNILLPCISTCSSLDGGFMTSLFSLSIVSATCLTWHSIQLYSYLPKIKFEVGLPRTHYLVLKSLIEIFETLSPSNWTILILYSSYAGRWEQTWKKFVSFRCHILSIMKISFKKFFLYPQNN